MSVEVLFQAYYNARRHKRSTTSALVFEMNYESELFRLYDELISGQYQIGPSDCFICFWPVKREIFAAGFRDRIVHHFIYNYINPVFERLFINDSYSCRIGKGTSYGVRRAEHFIRSCSSNYSRDCYILKLDISGYFMSLGRDILYQKVLASVRRYQDMIGFDVNILLRLIRQVIYHDATENCRMKAPAQHWRGLPRTKSLFWAGKNKGLPIGNLTSQLFGNVYLNDFDHFIKCKLQCGYYGRYVDDLLIVHRNKQYLTKIVPVIDQYLNDRLGLHLHRRKTYLQHYSRGVRFLGTIIKPYRIYIGNKTKANCYNSIKHWNTLLFKNTGGLGKKDVEKFVSSINAYVGMMGHYNSYNLRRTLFTERLALDWNRYIKIASEYDKVRI